MPRPDDRHPPSEPGAERQLRIALSRAEHHRRRRRVALVAALTLLVVLVAVVATSSGSSGSWDPVRLREGAIEELPKLRLEQQANAAAAQIERQKHQRAKEDEAVAATLAKTPFVRQAGAQHREVALTFDDGPGIYTERILDALRRGHARGTFFVIGRQISSFPIPLQRSVAEGNEIGDHTWDHRDVTKLTPKELSAEITDQATALQQDGIPRPRLFRPPYGVYNDATLAGARKQRMLTVMWTIDSSDYIATNPQALSRYVLGLAKPGAIILMHDGGGNRTVTSEALPLIIHGLSKAGYRTVTVPRLLLDNPPDARQQPVAPAPA
ncbi:MAG TPA: polysaccharide deacetylase family protein [Solirubrobacteraceae bacterium]